MALRDKNLPTISITKDDEEKIENVFDDDPKKSTHSVIRNRKYKNIGAKNKDLKKDDSHSYHDTSNNLLDNYDSQNVFDEVVHLQSNSPLKETEKKKVITSSSFSATDYDLLSASYCSKGIEKYGDGTTDLEDLYASDDEDNYEESDEKQYDDGVLDFMKDDETVKIIDSVRKLQPTPSPPVTPEPYLSGSDVKKKQKKAKVFQKKSGSGSKRKLITVSQLSPRSLSPHLSDITDTEIIYSDSEDDIKQLQKPQSNQLRRRHVNKHYYVSKSRDDIRMLKDMTAHNSKRPSLPEIDFKFLSIAEPSVTVIADKEVNTASESDIDTENEFMDISHSEDMSSVPPRKVVYKSTDYLKKEKLNIPSDATDVENFDSSGSSDADITELNSEILKHEYNHRNLVTSSRKQSSELHNTHVNQIVQKGISSIKHDVAGSEMNSLQEILVHSLWKDKSDNVEFIEINGELHSVFISPNVKGITKKCSELLSVPKVEVINTDTEDLHSSLGSNSEDDLEILLEGNKLLVPSSADGEGALTDTESFEGEDEDRSTISFRPKTPEPPEYNDNIPEIPEPVRELILLREDHNGQPVTVVLPLGDAEPVGLSSKVAESELSEVEDIATESADESLLTSSDQQMLCSTPELPDLDGGIIQQSEIIKINKKKLKPSNIRISAEPLTDTEDIYLSTSNKRKRNKHSVDSFGTLENSKLAVTDTEDLEFSDVDSKAVPMNHELSNIEPDAPSATETELDDLLASDDETVYEKLKSVSPDCLQHMSCGSVTALKETSEPLSFENKQKFLNSASNIPTIHTISPSPDIPITAMTDTDEMFTSADEEGYSRAETATPFENILLDDNSSVIHMKHTQLFDLDAPGEAVHIKGSHNLNINDTLTDIEELGFSEEERIQVFNHLSVNETEEKVCVCVSSNSEKPVDVACVCINKEDNELSLTWCRENITSGGEDWANKSFSHETGKLERDEMLSEQLEALEKSSTTDKPSGSGSSGASSGIGLPPAQPFL